MLPRGVGRREGRRVFEQAPPGRAQDSACGAGQRRHLGGRRHRREAQRQAAQHQRIELGTANDLLRGRAGRERRPCDLRRAGRQQTWPHRSDDVGIARRAELAERPTPGRLQRPRLVDVAAPGGQLAQDAAQTPQRHAQLVQMLRRAGAAGDLGAVGQGLRQRRLQGRLPDLVRPRARGPGRAARLHRGHLRQAEREAEAAFGLGPPVPPQPEARGPAPGQHRQRLRRAAEQLELDLVDRQPLGAGDDLPMVIGDLDQRAAEAQAPVQAVDFGAVQRLQLGIVAQGAQQRRAGGRTGMALRVQRRSALLRRQANLVFQAAHQVVAAALERLHPHAPFLAQAQRQSGRGQPPVGRLGIEGLQPGRARRGRGHRAAQGLAAGGRYLELELDLQRTLPFAVCGWHGQFRSEPWQPAAVKSQARFCRAPRTPTTMPLFWKPYTSDVTDVHRGAEGEEAHARGRAARRPCAAVGPHARPRRAGRVARRRGAAAALRLPDQDRRRSP